MIKIYSFFLFFFITFSFSHAQVDMDVEAFEIKSIYDLALTEGDSYNWLRGLTDIGHRLAGSENSEKAIYYLDSVMKSIGFDTVYLQECTVSYWSRGDKKEEAIILSKGIAHDLNCLALGTSVATPEDGLKAQVIEVHSLDEVDKLGDKLRGKIVFYNRPMDPTKYRTFSAYGGAVDQRVYGADRASKYGAIAVVVRSMTTQMDDIPHTGVNVYKDAETRIPAISISTNSAHKLSKVLSSDPNLEVFLFADCKNMDDRLSYNVIGEKIGTLFPDEIILTGGHNDSWDVGEGAHDDGAGCVQAMDALSLLLKKSYVPQRTWRCVLFANEENGLKGGLRYAEISNEKNEFHLAAIESDAGGFTPRGFSMLAEKTVYENLVKNISSYNDLLDQYGLDFTVGGAGADINPLKSQNGLLVGFRPDSQRYFDIHHTEEDTFDKVNKRELELGTASISSLVYLIDKYGL